MKDKAVLVIDFPRRGCVDCPIMWQDRHHLYCGAIVTDDNIIPDDAEFHENCPLVKIPFLHDKGRGWYDRWLQKLANTPRLEDLREYLQKKTGAEFDVRKEDDFVIALERPVVTETGEAKYMVVEIVNNGLYQITIEKNWWDEDKEVTQCHTTEAVGLVVSRYTSRDKGN